MSGKAPCHWLELGVMDPQGHSLAELVLEPQQPHEPGSLWVNGQCPYPCWPPDLHGSLATAIHSGCCCQTMAGCWQPRHESPQRQGEPRCQSLCLRGCSGVRRGPFYHGGPAFSGLSNAAQLGPSSSVGWHQPRFSVGLWRQHCHCTPATQGLKLAWQAENLHGHCPSALLRRIIQAPGAKMSEQIAECEHQAGSGEDGDQE